MLERPKFPKSKNVLLIVDFPTKGEVAEEDPFASPSNMNLLTSLKIGKLYSSSKTPEIDGIPYGDVYSTYFDYRGKLEYEYKDSFAKRKDLEETPYGFVKKEDNNIEENYVLENAWFRLEHQKDCFVRQDLWLEFQGLLKEIDKVKPKLVIVTGKWAFFFLSGTVTLTSTQGNFKDIKPLGGLNKFRASVLKSQYISSEHILYPMYHTLYIVQKPAESIIVLSDLERVINLYHTIVKEGISTLETNKTKYIYGTDKFVVLDYLNSLLSRSDTFYLAIDIETLFESIIDCISLVDSTDRGICIPFCHLGKASIWSFEDELEIHLLLFKVLSKDNIKLIMQNGSYEQVYFYKVLGFKLKLDEDTLLLNHILFNHLPKDLAFLASIYVDNYVYWKDNITASEDCPETRWKYNIDDSINTLKIFNAQLGILSNRPIRQQELYRYTIDKVATYVARLVNRGILVDIVEKDQLFENFTNLLNAVEKSILDILQLPEFNIRSSTQKKTVFKDYLDMELIEVKRKGSGEVSETTDAASMLEYIGKYPEYRPLLSLMLEYNALKIFTTNFLGMKLDEFSIARTNIKIAGTDTGRFSSTKTVFREGANLQTLPTKGKVPIKYSLESIEMDDSIDLDLYTANNTLSVPNVKRMFIPRPGFGIADSDFFSADIQITAKEANCEYLLEYFKNPRGNGKVYWYMASNFFGREITDKEYKTYKAVYLGSTYRMGITKLCSMTGLDINIATELQKDFFNLCPEIPHWHKQLEIEQARFGYLETVYGRRRYFLDKGDKMILNKMAAFKPSSTIADLINKCIVNVLDNTDYIEPLLQCHDAGVFEYPISREEEALKDIKKYMTIEIPYEEPLIIQVDLQYSRKSYGDVSRNG